MVKKFVITLLLFLYLMPIFGINVTVHYCGGEISSIAFGKKDTDTCACENKKMKKNCCQDKKFSFQVDDDQIQTQQISSSAPKSRDFKAVMSTIIEFNYICFPIKFEEYYFHNPPNKVKPPIYILNQAFRI